MSSELPAQKKKILNLVAHDFTNREIADLCNIQKKTVDNHVRYILTRLNARTRVGAVIIGVKDGIIDAAAIEPKRRK